MDTNILEIQMPCFEDLVQLMDNSTPFVVRKGVSHWPALDKWTGEAGNQYLISLHGGASVDVAISEDGVFSGDVRKALSASISLVDFLQGNVEMLLGGHEGSMREAEVKNGGRHDGDASSHVDSVRMYLAQCPLHCAGTGDEPVLPKLMRDIDTPPCLGGRPLCSVNLWMCRSRGTESTLHYDGHHNLLCMVSGSKTLTLYPPDDDALLASLHPIFAPSCNHCSEEGHVKGIVVSLCAGDCMFIPEGWFHKVSSAPHTCAVNLWWPGLGSWLAATPTSLATSCCSKVGQAWAMGHSFNQAKFTRASGAGACKAYFARRLFEGMMEERMQRERSMSESTTSGTCKGRKVEEKEKMDREGSRQEKGREHTQAEHDEERQLKRAKLNKASHCKDDMVTNDSQQSRSTHHWGSHMNENKESQTRMDENKESQTRMDENKVCSALESDERWTPSGRDTGIDIDGMRAETQQHGVKEMTITEQCEMLRGLQFWERNDALMQLNAAELEQLFEHMDERTADHVTQAWESVSDADQQRQQEFYERLWASFSDGGARARSNLMTKKEAFACRVFANLVHNVLGFKQSSNEG